MVFCTLGQIVFTTLQSPQEFDRKPAFKYAKHPVAEAAPRLQAMARELKEITLAIILHAFIANPEATLQQLENAMLAHQAMPLVLGNGTHLGNYVIIEMPTTAKKFTATGYIVAIEVRLTLWEYVAGAAADPNAPPQPSSTPPALVQVTAGSLAPGASVAGTIVTNPNGTQTVVFLKDNTGTSALLSNPGVSNKPPISDLDYADVGAPTMVRAPA